MAYEQYRRWIILSFPDVNRGPVLDLVAGSFAGGTAVLFTYPLDLVRTKLAYQVSTSLHERFLKFSDCIPVSNQPPSCSSGLIVLVANSRNLILCKLPWKVVAYTPARA